jgi:hypothetical protein
MGCLGRIVCLADYIAEQRLLGKDSCPRRSTAGKVGLHQGRFLSLGMQKDNLAVEMLQRPSVEQSGVFMRW